MGTDPGGEADVSGGGVARPGLGRRMARGTVAQQAGQAVGMAVALVTTTALARELSLSEFGAYGLVVSFSTYLYFALGSAETASVNAMAAAVEPGARERAFAAAVAVYAGFGLIAGVLIAGVGVVVLTFLVSGDLLHETQLGAVAVGVAIVLGWPAKVTQDLLRAEQRFALASLAEAIGNLAMGATLLVLLFALESPLWLLIATGSALPLYVGLTSVVITSLSDVPSRFRPSALSRSAVRDMLGVSGGMLAVSASDLAINQLDRTVLAAFRSTAVVGLYEGAIRLNNIVRAFTGTFSVTLIPVLSRLSATGDAARERELLLRGTRYLLAAVVPPTIVLMMLADRILEIWLGPAFAAAGGAAAIFLAWWLFAPNVSVASSLLVVDRELRKLAIYSWAVAALNLALSLILTPIVGLEGPVIGTTAAYLALLPLFMRFALQRREVGLRDFARAAWIPCYGFGLALAALMGLARLVIPLDSASVVVALAAGGVAAYWAAFYAFAMDAGERDVVRGILGRQPRQS